jgi:VWFA-related protein
VISLAALEAQSPGEPHFRVSADLVQVDAVVTDAKGRHIRDLEAADFQILEDGKPQKITSFFWVAGSTSPRAPEASVAAPRNLAKEEISRSIVLMFDDSGRHAEQDLTPILPSVRKFIAEQMGPHDLAAVTASRGGMGYYEQFTNDKQQLYAALDRLARRRGFGMWTLDIPEILNPDTGKLEPAFVLKPGEPGLGYRDPDHPPNAVAYLMWAIDGLQTIPGRKTLVLFTHAFAAPRAATDLANRAGVVVHVIDTHGFEGVESSEAPFRQLAQQTGGLFLRSAPGAALDRDLVRVFEDAGGYYLLGYRPDIRESDLQGRVARHDIKVRVLRPGLEVRARHGYLGVPDAATPRAPKTSADFLMEAVSSPFRAGRIRVEMEPRYRASAPDAKSKLRSALLEVAMQVEGRDLKFADGEDGNKALAYSAVVIVSGPDGAPVAREARTFSMLLTSQQAAEAAATGVRPSLEIRLPAPGPYQVRGAVRDESSGEVGSAYTFVQAPDFNQARLTLSSIDLSAYPDRWDGSGRAASGYAAGAPLYFRCGLFGFRTTSSPPHDGKVEVRMALFRAEDGRPQRETSTIEASPASLAEHIIAGRLDLADLEPGEYTMQLLAWDRLARTKSGVAAQWTRFRIAANGAASPATVVHER